MIIKSARIAFTTPVLTILSLLSLSSFSWAHHGWGGYNADIDTSLTVTELRLGGSHDHLTATDGKGQEWDLVLATPARNRRLGFNENTLSVGDQIDLIGRLHPSRPEVKVHCIYMAGETLYTYYDWDGTTSLSKLSDRDQC
jgi:hypothetical protein